MQFKRPLDLKVYQTYFNARTTYPHGMFLHITITPKGNHIGPVDLYNRVQSTFRSSKAIDWALLMPEESKDGVHHYHGFLHVKDKKNKLLKIKKSTLITLLIADQSKGTPEGWMMYCLKDNPRSYFVYKNNNLKKNIPRIFF